MTKVHCLTSQHETKNFLVNRMTAENLTYLINLITLVTLDQVSCQEAQQPG